MVLVVAPVRSWPRRARGPCRQRPKLRAPLAPAVPGWHSSGPGRKSIAGCGMNRSKPWGTCSSSSILGVSSAKMSLMRTAGGKGDSVPSDRVTGRELEPGTAQSGCQEGRTFTMGRLTGFLVPGSWLVGGRLTCPRSRSSRRGKVPDRGDGRGGDGGEALLCGDGVTRMAVPPLAPFPFLSPRVLLFSSSLFRTQGRFEATQ
ncbi:hypothetical protein QBC39DRAFT_362202 [Podospora conica]|nr:hypothetical protein QBC39DRAFT_362202 [Schizothecium conicum]